MSVQSRGALPNSPDLSASLGVSGAVPALPDGGIHSAIIRYVSGTLTVFLDDTNTAVLTVALDLGATLTLDRGQHLRRGGAAGRVPSSGPQVGESTNAPHRFSWLNVPPGQYSLTAVAHTTDGRFTVSLPIRALMHPEQAPIGIRFATGSNQVRYPLPITALAGVVPACRHDLMPPARGILPLRALPPGVS